MKSHALAALEILNRRRYARRNFLTALLGGSEQNRRKEIAALCQEGYLTRHSPNGTGAIERAYPHYFFRIYEKTPKADKFLLGQGIEPIKQTISQQFWHQVLVDDILLSIETACKRSGLAFRDQHHILRGAPCELSCKIAHTFKSGKTHHSDKALAPDALFAINNTYFALEADRNNEPIARNNLNETSYLRKLLQYQDVLKNRTYKEHWDIPNLLVLNVTTNEIHMRNIMAFMRDDLQGKSRSLLFKALPTLSSSEKSPQPVLSLLTDPWQRVGHEPFMIGKEVM